MADIEIDRGILELERKVGAPAGFFERLLDEDDWSFVIKLHALFEAACTHLLVFHFKEPDLSDIFSRIELSNTTIGKLSFLKALELLGEEERKYIRSLSELRNSLVHDVRNSAFQLIELVENFDAKELKNFATRFSPYEIKLQRLAKLPLPSNPIKAPVSVDELIKRAKVNPKVHIWAGAYNTLINIVDMYEYSDYKQYEKAKQIFDDED